MTEQEAIARIHSVYPTGKKHGVENMRQLMNRLGNVQGAVPAIHVAGTNGKGSCCAMLERVLRAAGYRTGLYTSPYIERYNERIRLDGVPIAGDALAALVERVWPAVEDCVRCGIHVTEFELGTALAFAAFEQARVDVAIIEVGLGGRLDPTNIIHPLACVITGVGMDHMQYLGGTIEEIALEKAGILKARVPVSLGRQEKAAHGVLLAAARGLECPVIELTPENVRATADDVTFDVGLTGERLRGLTVSLRGCHQAENACAALGAIDALRGCGWRIPAAAIRAGMADVHWPGRLERFGHVLLDGAHNDPGVRALCAYLDAWIPRERIVLLSGMMQDKEVVSMTRRLSTRVHRVIATQPDVPRAMGAGALAEAFAACGVRAEAEPAPARALERARAAAGPEGIVLAAGSLYLIGAIRTLLEKEYADVI